MPVVSRGRASQPIGSYSADAPAPRGLAIPRQIVDLFDVDLVSLCDHGLGLALLEPGEDCFRLLRCQPARRARSAYNGVKQTTFRTGAIDQGDQR